MTLKKAFTLIELLIVVAIIAILAAIAVPNFLEAQTRAKVSRARSDLRTVATGIESYAVDNNKPPRMMHSTFYTGDQINGNTVFGIVYPGGLRNGVLQHGLSTPIAYLSTAWLQDPFVSAGDAIPDDEKTFTYQELEKYQIQNPASAFWNASIGHYGLWRMCSIGPDRVFNNNIAGGVTSAQIEYDPTNGTLSAGNIWRSQRFSEGGQPPLGPLMPAH